MSEVDCAAVGVVSYKDNTTGRGEGESFRREGREEGLESFHEQSEMGWGAWAGRGEGREDKLKIRDSSYWSCQPSHTQSEHTRGGLKYSTVPMLFALRDALVTSFDRLYLSILKLSVGPAESLKILNDGATSVRVNASKCVTPSAGAIVIKSFSLLRARSFTCKRHSALPCHKKH